MRRTSSHTAHARPRFSGARRLALAALVGCLLSGTAPARAASEVKELRLGLNLQFVAFLDNGTTLYLSEGVMASFRGVVLDPGFLLGSLTASLSAVQSFGSPTSQYLVYGFDGRVTFLRSKKVTFDAWATRTQSDYALEAGPDTGLTTTLLGATMRVDVPRVPRLVLTYEHSISETQVEDAGTTTGSTVHGDRVLGQIDHAGNLSSVQLVGEALYLRDSYHNTSNRQYRMWLTSDTFVAERWRLLLRGTQSFTRFEQAAGEGTSAVKGEMEQYTANAQLLYRTKRITESTTYDYVYTAGEGVEHSSNALSSSVSWLYRPNLTFLGGLTLGREDALSPDSTQNIGATRVAGSVGANASLRNPNLAVQAAYSYALGGTWVEGDAAGRLQQHSAFGSLALVRWPRIVQLELTSDLVYRTDTSALGDSALDAGAALNIGVPRLSPWRLTGRAQYRHHDALDSMSLRGRVSYDALTGVVSLERAFEEPQLRIGATAQASFFAESSAGYTSAYGGAAHATLSAANGSLSLTSLFQWEVDRGGLGGDTWWARFELRGGYRTGLSRTELVYWVLSSPLRTQHVVMAMYSRWFKLL